MSLYKLNPNSEPTNQEWTDLQKMQYRFGGVRYSFIGQPDLMDTDPTLQVPGSYPFPRGDQDVLITVNAPLV